MIPNQTGKDDWATPQYIVDWASENILLGRPFDLDAAAKADTAKAPVYFGPGGAQADAFTASWSAGRSTWTTVWCNPPYSRAGGGLAGWCARMQYAAEHESCVVVGLFFARTETRAWQDSVNQAAEVYLLRGRVKFIDPATGKSPGPAPAPSALVMWRPGYTGPPEYRCLDLRALATIPRST